MFDRQAYVARRAFPTRGDKAIRAQAIRGRMALHGLYTPVNAPWAAEFKRELLTFPAGKHDDQVDAIGLIGQLLDLMIPGTKPKEPEKRRWEYEGKGPVILTDLESSRNAV